MYFKQPTPGNGFIYILSNSSMPNVYKVGLTTNSIKKRIQELNTTGVPRPFQAEKVFEIPASKLRTVEQLAHRKLKNRDLHHGKEFFEGSLHDCVTAVEDAIYEITESESIDLIGEAKKRVQAEQQRRAEEQRCKDEEKRRREIEKQRKIELEQKIREANRSIDLLREEYVDQLFKEEATIKLSFWDKYIFIPLGALMLGVIGIGIILELGLMAWVGIALLAWWVMHKDKRRKEMVRVMYLQTAATKYPYFTAETYNERRIQI